MNNVYFHSRSKDGSLLVVPGDDVSDEELFCGVWRSRGLQERRIRQLWKARLQAARHGEDASED